MFQVAHHQQKHYFTVSCNNKKKLEEKEVQKDKSMQNNQIEKLEKEQQMEILKILHITNLNERFDGRLHYNTGKRLNNGFIRLGHSVLEFSDRDIVSRGKSIRDLYGSNTLNDKLIKNIK